MKKYITTLNEIKKLKAPNTLNTLIYSGNKHVKLLSPSVKEWPNSVYTYNKNDTQSSYHKSGIIDKIMRNYFNLTMINKNNKNSKRMRDLIRRSSTKKLFVSNAEIKHSSDKIIYTVYIFNKEKNLFSKKIYLLNKSLNKFNKYTIHSMRYLNAHFLRQDLANRLNKFRPINRLSTINAASYLKPATEQVINKSYKYKAVRKNFSKNVFLNKTTKGIIYYVNSYNVAKQQPLLQLKTKRAIRHTRLMYSRMKHTIRGNSNSFLAAQPKINSKGLLLNNINNHSSKKIAWRNLLKSKNNNYFSKKLLGLLTLSFNRKQEKILKSILFFNFARWVLYRFDIEITITKNKLVVSKRNSPSLLNVNNKNKRTDNLIGIYNIPSFFSHADKNSSLSDENKKIKSKIVRPAYELIRAKALNKKRLVRLNTVKMNNLNKRSKVLSKIRTKVLHKIRLNRLRKINDILFKLLILVMKKGEIINSDYIKNPDSSLKNIEHLFKLFKNKYLWDVLKNTLIKQLLGIHYLYKQSADGFKYNKFLVALKMALLKVYNKTPQINIVNLKYIHLNSDLLLEAVAIKLKNKKTNLLRTLKKVLKLVKLPRSLKDNTSITANTSHINLINKTSISDSNLGDLLNTSLNKMFFEAKNTSDPIKKVSEKETNNLISFNKRDEVIKAIDENKNNKLCNLRYKWVTGVKIEGKGRLTKRYRADRSLFKLKYKGSLKNINFKDIYNKNHLSLRKTQSMMLLKGQTTPNIQYSFAKWKRHIGSYGIKGWISSN